MKFPTEKGTYFKAERRGAAFPRELARSPSSDFEATLEVGGSASKRHAPGWTSVALPLARGEWKIEFNCLNSTGLLLKQVFIVLYSGTISALSALKFPGFCRRI